MIPVDSDLEIAHRRRYGGSFASVPRTWGRGRYRWVSSLSEGGQGYVELARDEWSNALVVVKGAWWGGRDNINPEFARTAYTKRLDDVEDAVSVQAALGEITHGVPALVDVVIGPSPTRHDQQALVVGSDQAEADRYNSEAFIVMQFVGDPEQMSATTLGSLVAEAGALTEAEVVDLADQVSATLDAMHTLRLQQAFGADELVRGRWVHGDIKPDNILVAGDPRRYSIVDLSTAALVPHGEDVLPSESTAGYAPPEGEHLTPRYDLYSLAATLLFALTGERPDDWLGGVTLAEQSTTSPTATDSDAREQRLRHLRGQLAARRVHPMVIRLIADCLPADPGRRLRDASVLRAEIAAVRTALAAREVLAEGEAHA